METPLFRNLRFIVLLALSLQLLFACASYGVTSNQPIAEVGPSVRYAIHQAVHSSRSNEVIMVLAFSGGGTRAAALAYGVLEAMRDTSVNLDGQSQRLLDEIDVISSVSGGSFTAAYYGLHGDGIFTDFENSFLRSDVSGELMSGLLDPELWVSTGGRTEMAVDYYEEKVFRGATFADLQRRKGPLLVINATDLGRGMCGFLFYRTISICCVRTCLLTRLPVPSPLHPPCRCCSIRWYSKTTQAVMLARKANLKG